jgi:aconitate hydratase
MARGTVVQKILDAHIVAGKVVIGEEVAVKIDQTLTQDATGTMAYLELEAMGINRVKTELSVSYVDHNTMQNGPENRNDHLYLQSMAGAKGIYFSRPGNGICHQIHLERFGIPGKTLLGSDSHTPTGGGIGMIAIGAGGLDVALAMAGKPFRMTYPKIIGINLIGKLSPWVEAKDVILKILSILTTKGNVGCIVEYFGDGVQTLSVPERATITNMGAELGVTCSIFPSDENTFAFLKAQDRASMWCRIEADQNVEYDSVINIDLATISPMASGSPSPDNVKTIDMLKRIKLDQIIVGSCTNSSFRDLTLVAGMLKKSEISKTVTFGIAPGSRQVMEMLAASGDLAVIIASGARIYENACGPCIGQGQSPANGTVSLRTFNRNFAGRTGTKGDMTYLVSPAVAVASAIRGEITDPRDLQMGYPELKLPEQFLINDNLIIPPLKEDEAFKVDIIRKPTIGTPPVNTAFPEEIDGEVILKAGDKITTDHIMPAGVYLKYRSNIPEYAKYVFECFSEDGKPSFADRASIARDKGVHGVIVARDSYGQGSSREHAAICPMYLGIKAVVALAIERIHVANLINFGILPLLFVNSEEYDLVEQNDKIEIKNVRNQLFQNSVIYATVIKDDNTTRELKLKHNMSQDDIDIVLAGGMLNIK